MMACLVTTYVKCSTCSYAIKHLVYVQVQVVTGPGVANIEITVILKHLQEDYKLQCLMCIYLETISYIAIEFHRIHYRKYNCLFVTRKLI